MNQKTFNEFIKLLSEKLKPINQLLFECFVLIVIHYFFNIILSKKKNTKNILNINKHKSFVYLFCIIFIILDWFIWNNKIQTSLFTAIILIYITLNISNSNQISTFIDVINDSKNINDMNIHINDINKMQIQDIQQMNKKEKDEIDDITYTPKDIDLDRNKQPIPYDKVMLGLNELNDAYKSDNPNIHITDSNYATIMLNDLYATPQYNNIKQDKIDKSLADDIHINPNITEPNIDLFRNPKKIFLDSNWLTSKDNTYNDTCSNKNSCSKNQNAICTLAKFGTELSECTNQENTITDNQLKKISDNVVVPLYKF